MLLIKWDNTCKALGTKRKSMFLVIVSLIRTAFPQAAAQAVEEGGQLCGKLHVGPWAQQVLPLAQETPPTPDLLSLSPLCRWRSGSLGRSKSLPKGPSSSVTAKIRTSAVNHYPARPPWENGVSWGCLSTCPVPGPVLGGSGLLIHGLCSHGSN